MSKPTQFVYVNKNLYTILIRDERGIPFELPTQKAVQGDFYARYAAGVEGCLTFVRADAVPPENIVRTATPRNDYVAKNWATKATEVLPAEEPSIEEPTVAEVEEPSEEPAEPETPVVEEVPETPKAEETSEAADAPEPTPEVKQEEPAPAPAPVKRGGRPKGSKNKKKKKGN